MAAVSTSPLEAKTPHAVAVEHLRFADLDGWQNDAHEQAYATFLTGCQMLAAGTPVLRPARGADPALVALCTMALGRGLLARDAARHFFEEMFEPSLIQGNADATGLLTGYYEPEFAGSREKTDDFTVPLLGRPDDLETILEGETRPGIDADLRGARRSESGFTPYPTRAEIEDGALGDKAKPVVWLKRASEAFIIHVQGSARIRLPDGSSTRLTYAGRNGQPYTSIGKLLTERGAITRDEMSLERLMGWLDAHPIDARVIMRSNLSYIFFTARDDADPSSDSGGPIGGAGVQLTAGRSLAVDRRFWSYGLPFWLEGRLPQQDGSEQPLRRLMIAQDTGSAILGPARGDFFFGSGPVAGTRAGLMRHQTRFIVLKPKGFMPQGFMPQGAPR